MKWSEVTKEPSLMKWSDVISEPKDTEPQESVTKQKDSLPPMSPAQLALYTLGKRMVGTVKEGIEEVSKPEFFKQFRDFGGMSGEELKQRLNTPSELTPEEQSKLTASALAFMPITQGVNAAGQAGRAAYDFLRPPGTSTVSPTASWLMRSALKPTVEANRSGDAQVAVDTLLKEGVNPTIGGVAKIESRIDSINSQIDDLIKNSQGTVDRGQVLDALKGTTDRFTKQVNPTADLTAIQNVADDFLAHPSIPKTGKIPVPLAQEMKKGTYRELKGKYGEIGSASTEAQKALARGLKEGVGQQVPQVVALNAEEQALIKTLDVMERRALMELNKNPLGLSLLAKDPKAALGFMADRSALFKSLVARMIYNLSKGAQAATNVSPNLSRMAAVMAAEESQ